MIKTLYIAFLGCVILLNIPAVEACDTSHLRTTTIYADTLVIGGDSLPYLLYKVSFEDENATLPLIIFFHGAGERGNDNKNQLIHVQKFFLTDSVKNRYSFQLFIPQCPISAKWVDTDWKLPNHKMPKEPTTPMKLANHVIDSLMDTGVVDTTRIYAVGLSMGGFGVWDLLQRRPKLCAAAIPMCGGGDPAFAPVLTDIPLHIYHGALDKLVLPQRSQEMYDAIVKAGGKKVTLTIYHDVAHACWTRPFQYESAAEWLFSQKK